MILKLNVKRVKIKNILFNAVILMFMISSFITAQWATDPNNSLKVSEWGTDTKACTDGNGGVFIQWLNPSYTNAEVYLQHVDRNGYICWAQPLFISTIGNYQFSEVQIVPDNEGGVYLSFTRLTVVDTFYNNYVYNGKGFVQRINAAGQRLWQSGGIPVAQGSINTRRLWLVHSNDGVIAVWLELFDVDFNASDYPNALFVQKISPVGEKMWGANGTLVDTTNSILSRQEVFPHLSDKRNGVITFDLSKTGNYIINRIDSEGKIAWKDSITNGDGNYFRTAEDNNGGCYLVALDQSFINYNAYKISPSGNFDWGHTGIVIVVDSSFTKSLPLLSVNDAGNIYFFWSNIYADYTHQAYARLFSQQGYPLWENPIAINDVPENKYLIEKLIKSDSTSVICFIDYENTYYAEKISNTGQVLWHKPIINFSVNQQIYGYSNLISDNADGFIYVWYSDYGVYAQQVSKNGNLGDVLSSVKDETVNNLPKEFALYQNYPNPFNPSTIISYQIAKRCNVKITVFNILGEKRKELVNKEQTRGSYQTTFDGSKLTSGIHLVRMTAGNYSKTIKTLLLK